MRRYPLVPLVPLVVVEECSFFPGGSESSSSELDSMSLRSSLDTCTGFHFPALPFETVLQAIFTIR